MKELEKECESILRQLISKHPFLQCDNKNYDVWGSSEAKEVVADLIIMINQSDEIQTAYNEMDWGK